MPPSYFKFAYKHLLSLAAPALLLLFTLLAAHPYVRPAIMYDEGFALTNGLRVLDGDAPFLDFWTTYPPGVSYVLAAAFSIAEPSIEVSRAIHLFWIGLITGFSYLLTTSIASKFIAVASTTIVTAWACLALTPSYSMTPAIALALASVTGLAHELQSRSRVAGAAGGVAGGLILFFRHDVSGYLFLSAIGCFALLSIEKRDSNEASARGALARYLVFYLVAALAGLAVILYRSGVEAFVDQALLFPALIQRDQRFLPFPELMPLPNTPTDVGLWLLTWLCPAMLCLTTVFLAIWRHLLPANSMVVVVISGTLSSLMLLQAFGRLDLVHVAPSFMWLSVTLCGLSGAALKNSKSTARVLATAAMGMLLAWSAMELSKHFHAREVIGCIYGNTCSRTSPDQNAAVKFVNSNFATDEPIFVGNTRHDRIHINDALLYFRLNRPIPTKWNEMHPGEVTTAQVQSQIVSELKSTGVRVAVLVNIPSGWESNASAKSSGVHTLDAFLRSQFWPVWRQGRYTVLIRRPLKPGLPAVDAHLGLQQ